MNSKFAFLKILLKESLDREVEMKDQGQDASTNFLARKYVVFIKNLFK